MAFAKPEQLSKSIRGDILQGVLAASTPLRLPELSRRYTIGLTPLRECLNRLAAERLVVLQHNKGFKVAPLSRCDLLDLERSRDTIVGAMLVDSVEQGGDEWQAGLVGAYHNLSQTDVPSILHSDADLALWTTRHNAFHDALLAGSSSVWMPLFAVQLNAQLSRYHCFIENGLRDLATTQPELAGQAAETFEAAMKLEPHTSIYEAALARDTNAAKAAFSAHSLLSIRVFEELVVLLPVNTPIPETLGTKSEAA